MPLFDNDSSDRQESEESGRAKLHRLDWNLGCCRLEIEHLVTCSPFMCSFFIWFPCLCFAALLCSLFHHVYLFCSTEHTWKRAKERSATYLLSTPSVLSAQKGFECSVKGKKSFVSTSPFTIDHDGGLTHSFLIACFVLLMYFSNTNWESWFSPAFELFVLVW